ncbi:c-type cytochrome domain-containing protein [Verrucomicrobium spinosum]|uniref:c-type cytochrome domain-containing protein n=1 Tax=Verrucomicrobium spinosum TaxID=2736 RepID=UPI0009EA87A1|nr:c-type cytochrome domain-containing protein [Verrucomicrobium spinosum]
MNIKLSASVAISLLGAFGTLQASTGKLSFNRDIQPLLTEYCYACHGPDSNHRKADLRLDDREAAIKFGALVPGKPEASSIIERILTGDADDLMPPPDSHKKLSSSQKELLRRWVAEGAEYEGHWAFLPPSPPPCRR